MVLVFEGGLGDLGGAASPIAAILGEQAHALALALNDQAITLTFDFAPRGGSVPRGTSLRLSFQGQASFLNSSRPMCPTGTDVQFNAGDVATFRSRGNGIWRLVSHFTRIGSMRAISTWPMIRRRIDRWIAYLAANAKIGRLRPDDFSINSSSVCVAGDHCGFRRAGG